MQIKIDAVGLKQTRRFFEGLAVRSADLHPVFEVIETDFFRVEKQQFASEGKRASEWAPLAPSTVARGGKVRPRGKAHPIEHDTGALEASLTGPSRISGDRQGGSFSELTSRSLTVGTTIPYAIYQQTGTKRMPARPLIDVQPADTERWALLVAKYLAP